MDSATDTHPLDSRDRRRVVNAIRDALDPYGNLRSLPEQLLLCSHDYVRDLIDLGVVLHD